jgi:glycosyltransferase involved in cell wall biosynthesis
MDLVQDGVTGLLMPPGDAASLARALDALPDNPELPAQMGQAGQLRAREFEASVITPRILEVFEAAIRDRSRTQSMRCR